MSLCSHFSAYVLVVLLTNLQDKTTTSIALSVNFKIMTFTVTEMIEHLFILSVDIYCIIPGDPTRRHCGKHSLFCPFFSSALFTFDQHPID